MSESDSRTHILSRACALITAGDTNAAATVISDNYPFVPTASRRKKISEAQATRIFVRDGFLDRYSGEKLIFPGALRLLHILLPDVIPYHLNWKVSATHPAFWQLCATVDHVVPVTRGGLDSDDSNLVTTSMLRNSAKAHWLLEELGWSLRAAAAQADWDGLLGWFRAQVREHPELLKHVALKRWEAAAERQAAAAAVTDTVPG